MKKSFTKKIILGLALISIIVGTLNIQPQKAHAIPVVVTDIINDSTYTGLGNFVNIWAEKIKSYVLDGLAWHIAKMMVQQITASVVSWINSGFQGSPSFLTNPGGYFANLGDQVTGDFIANTGILSGLCSPFNVDIRLSLALGQAGYGQVENYTCTLNSVIANVKNSTVNGASIQGFMNGDFKQGGWPAFISISEPNNNASGAYLQAHSDLLRRIGEKQGTVNQQLAQGSGFLSWQDCNTVTPAQAQAVAGMTGNTNSLASFQNATNQNSVNTSLLNVQQGGFGGSDISGNITGGSPVGAAKAPVLNLGSGSSIQTKTDASGATSYQDCQTKTPGSVINGQLEHVLGSGVDQLNLANSINEIVDSLLAQLVNKILQTGLGSVTTHPSGVTQSYITQLSVEANSQSQYSMDTQNINSTLKPYLLGAQQVVDARKQAIALFTQADTDLTTAQSCLQDNSFAPSDSSIIQNDINAITTTLNQLTQAEQPYVNNLTTANNNLMFIQEQIQSVSTVGSPTDLQNATQNIQQFISNNGAPGSTDALNSAKSDLSVAETTTARYETQAQSAQKDCDSMKGN